MYGFHPAPAATDKPQLSIVARCRHIVPKDRRIERIPSGYSVSEYRNDADGCYWFVVAAFEIAVRP